MKKAFLIVAIALSATANAQISKGQMLVGGSASFSSSKFADSDDKSTSLQFSPNAGYFFINNLAGGLRLNLTSDKTELGTEEFKASSYNIAPFIRYYFLPAVLKINVFADAGYGFGGVKVDNGLFESKSTTNELSIAAGPAFFLSPSTAVEVTLGYHSTKQEDAEDRYNTLKFGVGFQIHLGSAKK